MIEKVLAGRGAFKPRHPDAGRHVEADISRQVLALIDGGKVVGDLPHVHGRARRRRRSSARFRVYLKTPGTNAQGHGPLVLLHPRLRDPRLLDVPAFNASHGCLRVPIPDAWRIFNWLRIGDRVITYP